MSSHKTPWGRPRCRWPSPQATQPAWDSWHCVSDGKRHKCRRCWHLPVMHATAATPGKKMRALPSKLEALYTPDMHLAVARILSASCGSCNHPVFLTKPALCVAAALQLGADAFNNLSPTHVIGDTPPGGSSIIKYTFKHRHWAAVPLLIQAGAPWPEDCQRRSRDAATSKRRGPDGAAVTMHRLEVSGAHTDMGQHEMSVCSNRSVEVTWCCIPAVLSLVSSPFCVSIAC